MARWRGRCLGIVAPWSPRFATTPLTADVLGPVSAEAWQGRTLVAFLQTRTRWLADLVPFLKGFTMLFWATATWWIPTLAILGYWRHVRRRFVLRYDPLYWGAVFPLGMYTVCTVHVARVMNVPFLLWIPRAFVAIAVAAWMLTAVGLGRQIWRGMIGQGVV